MKLKYLITLLFVASLTIIATAQSTITGKVVDDETKESLPGVNILVKGSTQGTITDIDGNYQIRVAQNSILVFSYVGFETKEVNIGKEKVVNVLLSSDAKSLDEVVVTGYGTEVRRRDLTGSVAKVNMNDLVKAPVANFDEALAGRIAGVVVSSSEGTPGGEMNIVIRGNNSLTQGNSPLYVVDGFPFENFNPGSISSSDIESIDVLKDASSTSIYGARGANGVIIITTKKGREGAPQVTYDGYVGFQQVTKQMELMDSYEFVKLQAELRGPEDMGKTYYSPIVNEDGSTTARNLDYYRNPPKQYNWQDFIFRTAMVQNHNVNLSGGTRQMRYNANLAYYNQDGVLIGSNYSRFQGKISLDNKLFKDKVRVVLNANYADNTYTGSSPSQSTWSATNSLMYSVWAYRPVAWRENQDLYEDFYDTDVDLSNDYRFNPVLSLENEYRKRFDRNLIINASAEWEIIKNLKLKVSGGYSIRNQRSESFNNSKTRYGNPTRPEGVNASIAHTENNGWVNDNTLSYSNTFKRNHYFNALVGMSFQELYSSYYNMSVNNISNEKFGMSGFDEGIPSSMGSILSSWGLMSYLSRVNYNYKRRYYLTASFRADGSSKFAPEHRWGYFPSGSVAWSLGEEDFITNKQLISNAKLRLSWGLTGNNRVGDFDYLAKIQSVSQSEYSFDNNSVVKGMVLSTIGNPRLKWETTEQTNFGIDFGMFEQRLTFTVDLYHKVTRDLLLRSDLPATTGYLYAFKNIGSIQNQGLEFTIGADIIRTKKFLWNSNFNISFNETKVLALADDQESMLSTITFSTGYSNEPPYIAKVGEQMGQMYGYIYEGTYKYEDFDKAGSQYILKGNVPNNGMARNVIQPGDEKYKDINGDGEVNHLDRTVIGRGTPIFTGGWNNNFSYMGFTLNVFFQYSYGNDIINANRLIMEGTTKRETNQFASFINRWTPENPNSDMPRANGQRPDVYSSRIVEDGSFLRLKTLALSYSFPKKMVNRFWCNDLTLSVAAQNIFTVTNYSGYDPEVSVRHSALTPGFDFSAYPRAFTCSFGLKFTF